MKHTSYYGDKTYINPQDVVNTLLNKHSGPFSPDSFLNLMPPILSWPKMKLNGFELRKFVECKPSEFASKSAFLVAAEGQFREAVHIGVDPDSAGSYATGDLKGLIHIAGPNPGR